MKKFLPTITVFALLALAAGILWYQKIYMPSHEQNAVAQRMGESVANTQNMSRDNTVIGAADIDTSNWKEYCNEGYGFCVKYPEGWEVRRLQDTDYKYIPRSYLRIDIHDQECAERARRNEFIDLEQSITTGHGCMQGVVFSVYKEEDALAHDQFAPWLSDENWRKKRCVSHGPQTCALYGLGYIRIYRAHRIGNGFIVISSVLYKPESIGVRSDIYRDPSWHKVVSHQLRTVTDGPVRDAMHIPQTLRMMK